MPSEGFISRLLLATYKADCRVDLSWHFDEEGQVHFFINCSDAFHWATSDAEDVTEANIEAFEKACEECKSSRLGQGPLLFCARMRGMRPQGAMYKYIEDELWPLFDACGPERSLSEFGNTPKPEHGYRRLELSPPMRRVQGANKIRGFLYEFWRRVVLGLIKDLIKEFDG